MAVLLLCCSCGGDTSDGVLPFVQPAGVIPKPQWPEIRKPAEGETRKERSHLIIQESGNFNNA